jgi:hypothetical protein
LGTTQFDVVVRAITFFLFALSHLLSLLTNSNYIASPLN